MNHLLFMVWMLCFPLVVSLCRYLDSFSSMRVGYVRRVDAEAIANWVLIAIWFVVGKLLY